MNYTALFQYSRVFGAGTEFFDYEVITCGNISAPPLRTQAALRQSSTFRAFDRAFALYRQLPLKPTPPQEALDIARQAEIDVRQQNLRAALDHYFQAIQIAPWWAEAHFNLALVM
jgi:hypothetical protein